MAFQTSSANLCFPLLCSVRWKNSSFSRWQQWNWSSSLRAAVPGYGLLIPRAHECASCPSPTQGLLGPTTYLRGAQHHCYLQERCSTIKSYKQYYKKSYSLTFVGHQICSKQTLKQLSICEDMTPVVTHMPQHFVFFSSYVTLSSYTTRVMTLGMGEKTWRGLKQHYKMHWKTCRDVKLKTVVAKLNSQLTESESQVQDQEAVRQCWELTDSTKSETSVPWFYSCSWRHWCSIMLCTKLSERCCCCLFH